MSASREKKQRKTSGPSSREAYNKKKETERKRKIILYSVIAAVVVALVAVLLIWNSGLIQRHRTVVEVGDSKYTINDVSYYYQQIRYNNFIYDYYLGYDIPDDDEIMDYDTGETYRDYFLEETVDNLWSLTALYDNAVDNGYSERDVKDTIKSTIDSVKSSAVSYGYDYKTYLKAEYGSYMTPRAYKSIVSKIAVANAYYYDYQDSLSYSDETLQEYYEENQNDLDTFVYTYMYFAAESVSTTDEDGNDLGLTDDEVSELRELAMAEAEADAEHALEQYLSGTDMDELVDIYQLSSYGDHTVNLGDNISAFYCDDLYEYEIGESGIVERSTAGYYAVILHDRYLIETPTADVRHILVSAETTTDEDGNVIAPTQEAWDAALEKAESILAEYQSGEQTEDAFAALANQYTDDTGSNTTGGLYSDIAEDSSYVPEFLDWIFGTEHSSGDVGIIQHVADEDDSNVYYGYHIMYYVGDGYPVWAESAISALQSDDLAEWLDGLRAVYDTGMTSKIDLIYNL